jgi:hypothetical protein
MRDQRIAAGLPRDQVYEPIYWVLAGLLVLAFLLNLFIRPVHSRFHMTEEDPALAVPAGKAAGPGQPVEIPAPKFGGVALLAWAAVCIPLGWGVYMTLAKAAVLLK